MGDIEESVEYRHLIPQGIPKEVAWNAAWIDRAYNHLVRNGMAGPQDTRKRYRSSARMVSTSMR